MKHRVREWIRRYLPYEIFSTAGELGAAAGTYAITDSLAAAAVAGTLGAAVGYYATAFIAAVRLAYRQQPRLAGPMRVVRGLVIANLLAVRSVSVEFGLAECVDSFGVRPVAYYLGPTMLGNVIVGWVVAKLVSDAAFYLCAIVSYEKFGGLVVRRDGSSS